jgi:hypothetical protein
VQNPLSNQWIIIDPNTKPIHVDGVADVAIIKTGIDFTGRPDCCLQIYDGVVYSGDPCYIVGNPGNYDEDSFSFGCVRDANYTDPVGYQITNSIFVNAPGIGGNSGGPIVNLDGYVIGIFTFGLNDMECFGGGSNHQVLRNTLPILKNSDNKTKLYLGLAWQLVNPFIMKPYYNPSTSFGTEGVYINAVSNDSPFNGTLQPADLLLSCQIQNGPSSGTEIIFGRTQTQLTPGVLLYYPIGTIITIKYKRISSGYNVITATITLNKTYNDVSSILDSYLQTGLIEKINSCEVSTNVIKYV